MIWKKIFWQNHQNSCWILVPFLSEAVEAVQVQKSFKWWIRHKFPLLRKLLSISFWQICQNIWSSQVFTLSQFQVDPVIILHPFLVINYSQICIERRIYSNNFCSSIERSESDMYEMQSPVNCINESTHAFMKTIIYELFIKVINVGSDTFGNPIFHEGLQN